MASNFYASGSEESKRFLYRLIARQVNGEKLSWFDEKLKDLREHKNKLSYSTTFSQVPRFLGKDQLNITVSDLKEADTVMTGFNPASWSIDRAARVMVVLSVPQHEETLFKDLLDSIYANAIDADELVALHSSIPFLPYPEIHFHRATDGLRSNMMPVFDAVALSNPYPATYFTEGAWNQMVLKSIFIGRPIYKIHNIDKRVNPELARMLVDYAHERWAAGRTVTPELWRSVGPFINEENFADIVRLFNDKDQLVKQAAALASYASGFSKAHEMLSTFPDLKSAIEENDLTWDILGKQFHSKL